MSERCYAAVDLGASNGRVMLGRVDSSTVDLVEVHRFDNEPVRLPDGLHWDILGLFRQVLVGLHKLGRSQPPRSVGVDSWGVDYGLLDADRALLGNPYHYRDPRTDPMLDALLEAVPAEDIYAITGIQFLTLNTACQLLAARSSPAFGAARTMLLIPDLLTYWLTGSTGAERTNASTTQLYDVHSGQWSTELIGRLGLPEHLFPPLVEPGTVVGPLLPGVARETRLDPDTPVVAVCSHDTASAVAAIPAAGRNFAYISAGTWSLVGVELDAPVVSEASRRANFTNEVGVDGTIRFLRNVMGLWLLQECQRNWRGQGITVETADLLAEAERCTPFAALVNPDDPAFLAPGDMPARIAGYCERTGQAPPRNPGEYARCVVESLAIAHRASVREAARLSDRTLDVIHLVGGGAHNALLCQLTADACGLPVVAGPVEATALGNVLMQARADGQAGDLASMRRLVASTRPLRRFEPRGPQAVWEKAAERVGRA
jgi:rhamnulokinase